MKKIFEKWWRHDDKVFGIYDYSKAWKKHGNKPTFEFRTNGAKKKVGDKCLDVHLTIGYVVFNYVNFNLQGVKHWKNKEGRYNDTCGTR